MNLPFKGDYTITSTFKQHIATGRPGGIDYATPHGTPIYAMARGEAVSAIDKYGGLFIDLYTAQGMFRYLHLKEMYVGGGEIVEQGQYIGQTDNTGWSTGNHLHFEYWVNGIRIDPTDIINKLNDEYMALPESLAKQVKAKLVETRRDGYLYDGSVINDWELFKQWSADKVSEWWISRGYMQYLSVLGRHTDEKSIFNAYNESAKDGKPFYEYLAHVFKNTATVEIWRAAKEVSDPDYAERIEKASKRLSELHTATEKEVSNILNGR